MRRILPSFSKLGGHVFRPISLVVLISFDDKSNSAIRESKFSNNPFHFFFASLPFLPKTIVNLVDLLKWLYHAVRYIFKKLNLSSHQWTSKNTGAVLLFKTLFRQRNCFLSSQVVMDGKDGDGLKLERVGPTFSSFNAIPAKITLHLPQVDCVSAEGARDGRQASECELRKSRDYLTNSNRKRALRKAKITQKLLTIIPRAHEAEGRMGY